MMVDLHDKLTEILSINNFNHIIIDEKQIVCECVIEGHIITFQCILPSAFPYELPPVYIDKKCYEEIKPLPHVDDKYYVCTFDKNVVIPNFMYPAEIILESLIQARKIIHDGILKINLNDFLEEFHAYWLIESQGFAKSIVAVGDKPKKIRCYQHGKVVYIADNKIDLDHFLENSGIRKQYQSSYKNGIYLPLSMGLYPPFPNNNHTMYHAIKTACPEFYTKYAEFLKYNLSDCPFVLFSLPYNGKRHIELFSHGATSPIVNGFRRGHVPAEIAYLFDSQQNPISKYAVTDFSQKRLFYRGGTGITPKIAKIAVIGCGSVGSYIVEAMSEYGTSSFVLVDNDTLSSENIARHYCGYKYIGVKKTSALKAILCEHNPNIHVECYCENAFYFLENQISVLETCDVVFIATALLPLEYKVVELINQSLIKGTVVLIWVEPYLAGGHAIILHKPQNIFQDLFNEQFSFSEQIVINGDECLLKEAGCQSTFVPYSAFSLKQFIYTFLDYLTNENILKDKSGNYLCSWCGNLSFAIQQGCKISPQWVDSEKFTLHIERID